MLFCKDCKHTKGEDQWISRDWICYNPEAIPLRNIVTGSMPTCEDMRSNNGIGCGRAARWFEAVKPVKTVVEIIEEIKDIETLKTRVAKPVTASNKKSNNSRGRVKSLQGKQKTTPRQ